MVGICDILGFRQIVCGQPLPAVLSSHLGIFQRVLAFAVNHGDSVPEQIPTLRALRQQRRVGLTWFSDTVLVYGLDDSEESSRRVLETLGWLLFVATLGTYVRLRAGVDFGELHVDESENIYVGRALVRAYELQDVQDWAGGALTPDAVSVLPRPYSPESLTPWWVCSYDIPLKDDKTPSLCGGFAINWPMGRHERTDIPWRDSSPKPSAEEWQEHPTLCRRWQNLRTFHRKVCRWCD